MCNVRTLLGLFFLNFVVVQIVSGYSSTLSNYTRIRRQAGPCTNENFRCKSGECIDGDRECDGTVDCKDASDETNACRRLRCPAFLFTCKYGACINKELECDGKPDCRDASDEKTPNCRKGDQASSKCKNNEFTCSSGQCIDEDYKCDGKAECDDHTDEISATCWNMNCPGYTYRCRYGACVNGRAECNGQVECYDGSDEDPSICKNSPTPPPVTTPPPILPGDSDSCILPEHPAYGRWSELDKPQNVLRPGTYVREGTVLKVECNKKEYILEGNNVLYCKKGKWTSDIGRCLKTCPPRVSSTLVTVICNNNGQEKLNCTQAIDGTLAKFKCAPFYEDLALKKSSVAICSDGTWSIEYPNCKPVCGQKTVDATPLIINGSEVNKGDYPWQVALYTIHDKELICGGSLLSQRIILTAAHCVTNVLGQLESKEKYLVAVGKYYRKMNDTRDYNEAQFSELQNMFIAGEYSGLTQNYFGDIAILVTKKIFTLSRRVQPVCIDDGGTYNLIPNEFGYVTGWGFTDVNSNPSDVLKELEVPTVSIAECKSNLPRDYEIYLTFDKLCAGYLDKGASVCKGDSGGGLVFKHDGRYYVTGIVSVSPLSPKTGGCNKQTYALYTKVSNYIDRFILKKLADYK